MIVETELDIRDFNEEAVEEILGMLSVVKMATASSTVHYCFQYTDITEPSSELEPRPVGTTNTFVYFEKI